MGLQRGCCRPQKSSRRPWEGETWNWFISKVNIYLECKAQKPNQADNRLENYVGLKGQLGTVSSV